MLNNFLASLGNLGNLGNQMPGVISGFGGGTFDMSGRQVTPPQQGMMENPFATVRPQAQQAPQEPKRGGGGFLNTLGRISDVLALIGGEQPIYGPMRAQEQQQRQAEEARNALSQWLQNPNDQQAFMRALQADPDRTLGLREKLEGEEYTLGEGQARFQGSRQIARGPEKLDTIEVDGVVFDKRTGQPLFESPYDRIIAGPDGSFYRVPRMGLGRQPGGQQQPGQAATSGGPQPGAVVNGYRFRGGNPNDRNAWEPVSGGGAGNGAGTFRP